MALSRVEVLRCLRRLFSGGRIDLLPKRDLDRQILFGLAAWQVQTSGVDTEQAVNRLLDEWLSRFCRTVSLDHVTFRRELVDAGYIGRTSDGARYWINTQQIHLNLAPDCLDVDPGDVLNQVTHKRDERKRDYLDQEAASSQAH